MSVIVASAAESSARDAAAIDAGTPSRALMQRAGAAAAAEITRRFAHRLSRGVSVFAGSGNNGGDAWVVAAALASIGVPVRVTEAGEPRTDDTRAERALALPMVAIGEPTGREELVIDGILGTGARGRPRGAAAGAIARLRRMRDDGASVVALDVPSGVDATSGAADGAVVADLTVTFGTLKRGLLVARGRVGTIVVVDIGLGAHAALDDGAPELVDARWVGDRVPPIAADAHKGSRRRLAIVGGGHGMLGAPLLAARSASLSGAGIVRLLVAPENVASAQTAAYESLARSWPSTDDDAKESICDWAHAVLIGPGLGASKETRALVERVLTLWRGPVVVDADALNVFEGDAAALARLIGERAALVTPHVTEFGRLTGRSVDDVLDSRFDCGADLARTLGCVVLLKGVPTVISEPNGRRLVSAAGTPALAAAGSGDLLAGIAATLLAQTGDALAAAGCAAWIHGRAGEIASAGRAVRGIALGDVIDSLADAWRPTASLPRYPVLAELPAVGRPSDG